MIADSDIELKTAPVADEGFFDDSYDFKSQSSLEDETSADNSNYLDDCSIPKRYRRTLSYSDDSGFNSDSESRDYIPESIYTTDIYGEHKMKNLNCDDPDNKATKENIDFEEINKQNAEIIMNTSTLERNNLTYSENVVVGASVQRIQDLSVKLNTQLSPDCVLANSRLRNIDSGVIISRNNISSKSQITGKRHRPTSTIRDAPANPRTSRARRCGVQDLNNNEAGPRNLNSFMGKAPFKLQDCFQNQGILSLIACIVYTLALMIIISFLSLVMDYLKSYIGTQNLKKMRKNIVHRRCERLSTATG